MASYGPLSLEDDDDDDDDDGDHIELSDVGRQSSEPSVVRHDEFSDEHEGGNDDGVSGEQRLPPDVALAASFQDGDDDSIIRWEDPWLLSVGIAVFLTLPTLVYATWIVFSITGRMWSCLLFAVHLWTSVATAQCLVPVDEELSSLLSSASASSLDNKRKFCHRSNKTCFRIATSSAFCLDVALFGVVYPIVTKLIGQAVFTDVDGTVVVEWLGDVRAFKIIRILGWVITGLKCTIVLISLGIRCCKRLYPQRLARWGPTFWSLTHICGDEDYIEQDKEEEEQDEFSSDDCCSVSFSKPIFCARLGRVLILFSRTSALLFFWCILAVVSHFGPWPIPSQKHADCDPLDTTECVLPFPSFFHMVPDLRTATGWRVDLKGNVLPPLRGGFFWNPSFLNDLDGFSTMAPMLFYLKGMKEAHERGENNVELQGPERIQYSVSSSSVTLLLDVESQELVYHSAEIDYLDPDRPLVMVFPAQPLKHNTHYALAVVNAADEHGHRLPQTEGMKAVLKEINSYRRKRFHGVVIPALETAAPWVSFRNDPESLQLLFDFHTISEESQLGKVRGVLDATMKHLDDRTLWNWKDHVHTIAVEEGSCDAADGTTLIARTIHAELDVPWFLNHFGPGGRSAVLNDDAVASRTPVTIGRAKFMVRIPCSLREEALGGVGKKLRAVMEYGHGLFGSRNEVTDEYLGRMANDHGYILTAMDWRGMSTFDLPVVIKVMIGKPNMFEAVRDNLIQGYANKLALQHFTARQLLDMEWLQFERSDIPRLDYDHPPTRVFYGISQGGILGAGYTSLLGPTGLIELGILGVPGTPFSLVMTRSLDFVAYDTLLLLCFYNDRHVRILLTLVQSGWDSLEASGVLAPPVKERRPRLLLQAGLGDPIVPTSAAEALARALGASTLPNNPRRIFGIPTEAAANKTWHGPDVTLTELLYEKEYNMLPKDDINAPFNYVHYCVRQDRQLQGQIAEFVNTGRITNPCAEDQCRRDSTC